MKMKSTQKVSIFVWEALQFRSGGGGKGGSWGATLQILLRVWAGANHVKINDFKACPDKSCKFT